MKTDRTFKTILAALLFLTASVSSCKKTGYLKDGGISQNSTQLSTYDYLKSNGQFDTLLLIVDHFKLKDSLNNAATFFAFTDFTATKLMLTLKYTSLQMLYDSVSSKLLTQYMFSKPITIDNSTVAGTIFTSWAGSAAQCAVAKTLNTEYINLTSSSPAFNYFILTYIKINGVLDGSAGAPPDDKVDVRINCQTSGIKTSTGTLLNVLVNNAPINKL